MIKISNPSPAEWSELCRRPVQDTSEIEKLVVPIFNEVRAEGDQALLRYTREFDLVSLNELQVDKNTIDTAAEAVSNDLKEAISKAYNNIYKFHEAQKTSRLEIETSEGVLCWQEKRAIEKVGLYIPGGTAPLFSTILMLAIPAKIAACEEIILCTPPDNEGNINPAILYTAQICGVNRIFKIGGIQAIAGMTFGSESIPKVYKIFGPGNQYVTVAKQMATRYNVAIDMPAGPSELLVMADETADPAFVASDLLSQAEHGTDSQVILVSTSEKLVTEVEDQINIQIETLPRKAIAKEALNNCKLIYFRESESAVDFINEYGPEHYIIACAKEDFFLDGIINAGSVFLGNYTPESAGDYASGTNHTLPTQGYCKQYSGVNLDSFQKAITFQRISDQGLLNIGKTIELMAEAEGLEAHKNAVSIRLERINESK